MKQLSIILLSGLMSAGALAGCASISESDCLAQNWEEMGYKDGVSGRSGRRLGKITKSCGKYNIAPDREAYFAGYDTGVPLYCSYENGYARGNDGNIPKAQCVAISSVAYLDGHADGTVAYEIRREYHALVNIYDRVDHKLEKIEATLLADNLARKADTPEDEEVVLLTRSERDELCEDRRRLKRKLTRALVEVRAYEINYGLPKRRMS